jgi:hypothetical protein
MTGQRRLATLTVVALVAALAGCTAGPPSRSEPTRAAPTATAPQPVGEPPRPVVRAAVDLSAAVDGPATIASAVATPDGGAYVVLEPESEKEPLVVVTVDGTGAVVRAVPAPALAQVFGVHLLADGEVLITGQFPRPDRDYGFVAVDPVGGATRTVVAQRYEEGTAFSFGSSTLSADGSRLYLFVATAVDIRNLDLIVALDPLTGTFLGGRDLFEERRQISDYPVATHSAGLLPRPDGGVTLAFDVWGDSGDVIPDPGLLAYDGNLEPVGTPTRVRVPAGASDVQAAAIGPDGTVHLVVQPRDGDLLVTVRGTAAADVADLLGHSYDDSMTLDPAARWAVLPSASGIRAVDLRTGEIGRVAVGCPSVEPVFVVRPGAGPTRALLLGRCGAVPMLWLLGG